MAVEAVHLPGTPRGRGCTLAVRTVVLSCFAYNFLRETLSRPPRLGSTLPLTYSAPRSVLDAVGNRVETTLPSDGTLQTNRLTRLNVLVTVSHECLKLIIRGCTRLDTVGRLGYNVGKEDLLPTLIRFDLPAESLLDPRSWMW